MEVDLSPGHIVLGGDPAPLPKKGTTPNFAAHIRCGQTAGWTKMPLGMHVDLGAGDIVLDGNPQKRGGGAEHPQFWPMYCGQTAAWIKMPPGTWVGLGLGCIVLHGDPAPPPK